MDTNKTITVEAAAVTPHDGFSLVELLVVLTIFGILASMVYPSYADYVRRARRLEGKAALIEMMEKEERLYTRSNTYAAFSAAEPGPAQNGFRWWSAATAANSAYELQARPCIQAGLAQCVELVAMPGTSAVDGRFRDSECGTLKLISTGEQLAEGQGKACWP